ncbi:MAG TPA: 3-deoxy-7-phosphoheptulonate synthase class II [Acidimicrobiia bacterium]|jgi:3-deoxy-7-phosphoheptulonate synthase
MTTMPADFDTDPRWSPSGWREHPVAQQPVWPDGAALDAALDELRASPPLVYAGETRALTDSLARVARGEGFLLHAGDCAESFAEFSADKVRDQIKVILQMSVVLTYSTGLPTLKLGRIAGQYAKPRSAPTEQRGDMELETFRGDIVNGIAFDYDARRPDPHRLVRAYEQASATHNLLRSFTKGGFADLSQVHRWNLEFVDTTREGKRYNQLSTEIDRALRFMAACGIDLTKERQLHEVDLFTSHEALLLAYEEALTRPDTINGGWYDTSAHLLWIGERTRQLDGAHVHFLGGVNNPVAVKLGPTVAPDEAVELCRLLDPDRTPGRLTLVARMGAKKVRDALPPIVRAVARSEHPVVWACDPMHGNTYQHESGYKTRHFDAVMEELAGFFAVCHAANVWPGGVHVELTGDDVTECLGGDHEITADDLDARYETLCDPRLNARQSLELAFRLSDLMRS